MGKNPPQKATKNKHAETKPSKAELKVKKKAKKVVAAVAATADERKAKHCSIKGCKREYRAKGYCGVHYRKWRQGAYGRARYKTCKDYSCLIPMARNRHGYCEEHFQNYYVKGMAVSRAPIEAAKPAEKPAPAAAAPDKPAANG
jgi:hypothetical protein